MGVASAAVSGADLTGSGIEPGVWADAKLTVTDGDTAIALGSGSVAVLATPRVLALAEEATCRAVENLLAPGTTTVGVRVQLDHLAPTPVGADVVAEATVEKVEGRRVTFAVSVSDACGVVAAGRVTRVIVEVDEFLGKAATHPVNHRD
jgi:fluoroacetyl-CoA thioesterase